MKTFLVFLSLMMINVSFLSFHTDVTHYEKLQVYLKATVEEGAAGGALYQDEEAFRRGHLVIKEKDAASFISGLMDRTEWGLKERIGGKINYTVEIFDDEKGYEGCEQYGLTEGRPAVRLSMTVNCRDLFRLPFLTVTSVKRSAVYEWENRTGPTTI